MPSILPDDRLPLRKLLNTFSHPPQASEKLSSCSSGLFSESQAIRSFTAAMNARRDRRTGIPGACCRRHGCSGSFANSLPTALGSLFDRAPTSELSITAIKMMPQRESRISGTTARDRDRPLQQRISPCLDDGHEVEVIHSLRRANGPDSHASQGRGLRRDEPSGSRIDHRGRDHSRSF